MSRSPRPTALLVVPLALLIAATVGLAGWQLFAGDRLAEAGRWIERAQEWQAVLIATAEAVEDESLEHADGGGFHVPWESAGSHPFPIDAEDVQLQVQGMTAALPIPLAEHDEAARRIDESHSLLRVELGAIEKLGPLAPLDKLPPILRTAAIDTGGLVRPVTQLVAREAREAGIAKLALAVAAITCAVLLLVLVIAGLRARRDRDRLARHLQALETERART